MPTLEQIYDKLAELEQRVIRTRDGFALSDDTIADFFNIDASPGREIENPAIEKLINVQVSSGSATMINPSLQNESSLKSTAFQTPLDQITSAQIRPINEDVRAQFMLTPTDTVTEEHEPTAAFELNAFTHNVDIIPNTGQRDYGARLGISSEPQEYQTRETFAYGRLEHLWFLDRSNILWQPIDLNNNNFSSPDNTVLECTATEPLNYFSMPQYSLNRFGIALWSDATLDEKTEMRVSVTPISGAFVRTGIAIRMTDILNGYFAMLESEMAGSFVRLYKIQSGLVSKIAESQYNGSFTIGRTYEVWAKTNQATIEISIDGSVFLTHVLEPIDIVSIDGDFGIVTLATSSVRYGWVEMRGKRQRIDVASNGVVTTAEINVGSNISKWLSVELNSGIISGHVEIDYSIDGGNTFQLVPLAIIQYPDAVSKKFSLESIPVFSGIDNKIMFRARISNIGAVGWLRDMKIVYAALPELPLLLDNVTVSDGTFKLIPGALTGTVAMKYGLMPQSIYKWDRFIADDFKGIDTALPTNIISHASVSADSEQTPDTSAAMAFDGDLNTYWESMRGQQSWLMFEFPNEVEIFGFRWIKKSLTDGATFYRFQKYNAETVAFDDIHVYGFEVNEDIRHDFERPIRGTKFRLLIECVQPMSFGNARLIEIFGRSPVMATEIIYEYSYDGGATYLPITGLNNSTACNMRWDISAMSISQALRLRATLRRTTDTVNVYIRKFGARFIGRDSRATQITNLIYDLQIGDRLIMNCPANEEVDVRCNSGHIIQLKIKFTINPGFLFEHLKPSLDGYKIGLSSSRYQAQIDALQAHIYGVIRRADKNPHQDKLIDAILFLISQQIEQAASSETGVDGAIGSLLNSINKEVAKNRSRITMGDTGHLDEVLPSEVYGCEYFAIGGNIMPQVQTIYNGNYVVWQRKLAEIIIDLKTDVTTIRKLGLIIAESKMFNSTIDNGIYVSLEVASSGAPNTWSLVYGAPLNSGSWVADAGNIPAPLSGAWVENSYVFTNNVNITGRYLRFRIAADSSYTPLQTVALKKVLLQDSSNNSLLPGASAQVNVLGWQTGKVLKDILEDLLDENILITTISDEVTNARTSPKGTWDQASENYVAPIPKIFTALKARLDDLEKDAERRLVARKLIVPIEDIVTLPAVTTTVDTHIRADAPYRKIRQYASADDIVDVMVQSTEGIGTYEYTLRDTSGSLVIAKVTYGLDTPGYVAGQNAKITLVKADTGAPYNLTSTRTLKLIVPVETDLFHMDKGDLTRSQFATAVIQDVGIANDIDSIKLELRSVLTSDAVTQDLVVYQSGGSFYADLAFNSNAMSASGWQVLKNALPAIPSGDFTFIDNRKIRLDTHDNSAPTKWSLNYFTNPQPNLDSKVNEIIEAIARLATTINNVVTNLDEINDALVPHAHSEILQFDHISNDGFDYFKPLTYKARDIDNGSAIIYKNNVSIGAKDTVWAFRGDGLVSLYRTSEPYNHINEYSIRYYFRHYEHLVDKLQDMTNTTDRDLISRNWAATNPVPPEADSNGVKLI